MICKTSLLFTDLLTIVNNHTKASINNNHIPIQVNHSIKDNQTKLCKEQSNIVSWNNTLLEEVGHSISGVSSKPLLKGNEEHKATEVNEEDWSVVVTTNTLTLNNVINAGAEVLPNESHNIYNKISLLVFFIIFVTVRLMPIMPRLSAKIMWAIKTQICVTMAAHTLHQLTRHHGHDKCMLQVGWV